MVVETLRGAEGVSCEVGTMLHRRSVQGLVQGAPNPMVFQGPEPMRRQM